MAAGLMGECFWVPTLKSAQSQYQICHSWSLGWRYTDSGCPNSLLFAADNADHNVITLEERGTFHGMGMIAAIISERVIDQAVDRCQVSEYIIIVRRGFCSQNTDFQGIPHGYHIQRPPSPKIARNDKSVHIFWEMFSFKEATPEWQSMMHQLHSKSTP